MFKKEQRLKKEADFKKIFSLGRFTNDGVLSFIYIANDLIFNRFAVIVSSKVFKLAVKRNLAKRRLINILQNIKILRQGFDIIIIVKNKNLIKGKNLDLIKRVSDLLKKSRLL
ncbi:ribonuclease P protein component [Candidatus Azambacteria bacterium]|nr:ribonuclease P protein component [Candidatus Azambacteria bacterium]